MPKQSIVILDGKPHWDNGDGSATPIDKFDNTERAKELQGLLEAESPKLLEQMLRTSLLLPLTVTKLYMTY